MEELSKALGPWPILQFALGAIIFLGGAFMVYKGISGSRSSPPSLPPTMPAGSTEEERARWRTYEAIENIEEQVFKLAEQQRVQIELTRQLVSMLDRVNDTFRRLHDILWNRNQ